MSLAKQEQLEINFGTAASADEAFFGQRGMTG